MPRNRFVLPAVALVTGLLVVPASAAAPDVTVARSSAATLAADFTHTAFIDAAGEVWASGYQAYGALGNNAVSDSSANDPVRAALPAGVKAATVDLGGDTTIVLGDDGVLYGAGRNDGHQLSGSGDRAVLTPFAWDASVTTVPDVVSASAADYSSGGSTIVAGSDGRIYQTGNVLGTATSLKAFVPALPAGAGSPVEVVAGHGDYLVVTDLGRLYGFGSNDSSRLTSAWSADTWVPLDTSGDVVAVVAGDQHTAWLTEAGVIKVVGSDANGQLGTGAGDGSTTTPVAVPGTWTAIAGGVDRRTVAVDAAGQVKAAGQQPDYSEQQTFTTVVSSGGDYTAREVVSGQDTWLMRTSTGEVWGAGRQSFGQLRSGAGTIVASWQRQDDQPVRTTTAIAPLEPVRVAQPLEARTGGWVPTTASLTYEWRVNGSLVASGSAYTPSLADQQLQQSTGEPLVLTVSASGPDLTGRSETAVLGTIADGVFSSASTPTIVGTTGVGRLLRSSIPTSSPASTVTYEWLRDGTAIAGVSGREYRQTTADAGRTLTVRATFSAPGYATVQRLATLRKVPAYNSAKPTFSGTLKAGRRLTAKKGTWSGYKYAYAPFWYRNGVRISGATGWSYTLTSRDKGKDVAVRIYAKRTGWPTVFATSVAKRVAR